MTKEDRPFVWIVNEAGHDYSTAAEYGIVRRLSIGNVDPFRVDRAAYDLSRGLGRFSSERDFVLLSGAHVLNMLVGAMWFMIHDSMQILQWHAKKRKYILTTVTKSQLGGLIQRALEGKQ